MQDPVPKTSLQSKFAGAENVPVALGLCNPCLGAPVPGFGGAESNYPCVHLEPWQPAKSWDGAGKAPGGGTVPKTRKQAQ